MPRASHDGPDPTQSPPRNPFVFDYDGMLGRFDGDEPLMAEIISLFIEDFPRQTGYLHGAIEAGNWPETQRKAHALRSACANVGAGSAGYAALSLEEAARDCRTEDAERAFARLASEFRSFREAVLRTKLISDRPDAREGEAP